MFFSRKMPNLWDRSLSLFFIAQLTSKSNCKHCRKSYKAATNFMTHNRNKHSYSVMVFQGTPNTLSFLKIFFSTKITTGKMKVGECFRTPDLRGNLLCCIHFCQGLFKNSTRLREHFTAAVATGGYALLASDLRTGTTLEPPSDLDTMSPPSKGVLSPSSSQASSPAGTPPGRPSSLFSASPSTPGESPSLLPVHHVGAARSSATSPPRFFAGRLTAAGQCPESDPTSLPQRPLTESPPLFFPASPSSPISCWSSLSLGLISQQPLTESPPLPVNNYSPAWSSTHPPSSNSSSLPISSDLLVNASHRRFLSAQLPAWRLLANLLISVLHLLLPHCHLSLLVVPLSFPSALVLPLLKTQTTCPPDSSMPITIKTSSRFWTSELKTPYQLSC